MLFELEFYFHLPSILLSISIFRFSESSVCVCVFYIAYSFVCFVSQISNIFRSKGDLSSFTFIVITDRLVLGSIIIFFNDVGVVIFAVFLRGHSL